MADTRTRKSKSKHDEGVLKEAKSLERQGYNVKADIKDYPKPPKYSGLRPDIVARKSDSCVIVEVETRETAGSDHAKRQARIFNAAAEKIQGGKFKRKIV